MILIVKKSQKIKEIDRKVVDIDSKIEEIIEPHQSRFKLLEPFGEELNFSSLNEFYID